MGRILIAAICGVVLAVGLGPPSSAQTAPQTGAYKTQASIDQSLKTIASAATTSVQPVPPPEYEAPCGKGQDHRNSDLCAQWKAADQAEWGAIWSLTQAILSAAGIVGLVYSLHLTRRAVNAATAATNDAEEGLRIARENAGYAASQIEISEQNAKHQLRAYLIVNSLTFKDFEVGKQPVFWINFQNRGATPAKNVELKSTSWYCADFRNVTHGCWPLGEWMQLYDLGADQFTAQREKSLLVLSDNDLAAVKAGQGFFVFAGVIRYRDVFRRQRRTTFRAYMGSHCFDDDNVSMLVARRHNRSS